MASGRAGAPPGDVGPFGPDTARPTRSPWPARWHDARRRGAMDTDDRHGWVEHLGVDECWRLLAATPVGRVGVIVDSGPEIYPVNHAVDGRSIVFRTDSGNKLAGIDRTPA